MRHPYRPSAISQIVPTEQVRRCEAHVDFLHERAATRSHPSLQVYALVDTCSKRLYGWLDPRCDDEPSPNCSSSTSRPQLNRDGRGCWEFGGFFFRHSAFFFFVVFLERNYDERYFALKMNNIFSCRKNIVSRLNDRLWVLRYRGILIIV